VENDKKAKRDKKYMKKVLKLAQKGEGYTSPNPMVGAIVVKNDKIVGQGYHHFFGDAHAEANALEEAGDKARNAELYVNLEPCCHYGKTPPCYHKIIEAGVKRVIIGMEDPNPKICGKGIKYLKKAGIEVKTGVLEAESKKLNEFFIKYITTDYPFVILKCAQTLDGYLATSSGDSKWITNKKARNFGHKLRHKVDSILIGKNTLLEDNPQLTTRLQECKSTDSLRVVLDENLEIPVDSRIIQQDSTAKTLIVTAESTSYRKIKKYEEIESVEILTLPVNNGNQLPLKSLLNYLHDEKQITSLLVEGGGTVNYSFLKQDLIDKVYAFIAPKILGGNNGISVFNGKGSEKIKDSRNLKNINIDNLNDNILLSGYLN